METGMSVKHGAQAALLTGMMMAGFATLTAQSDLLVSGAQLREQLAQGKTVRIVDVGRSYMEYKSGHLPGAVYVDQTDLIATRDGVPGMLPPVEQVVKVLEQAGIGGAEVILYDDSGGLWASRLFWTLEYLGHERVKILDGGIDAWRTENGDLEEGEVNPARGTFIPDINDDRLVDLEWVQTNLGNPEVILVDARSQAEYTGSVARSYAGGHIPGAVLLNWQGNLDKDGKFLPLAELRRRFGEKGVLDRATAVTYCQIGVRAAHDYFALRLLEHPDVRLYDGSWAEWGNDPETPKTSGAQP
jgi:thiosulfate/3-mercaptopyruvate sulfurtransferase